MQKKISSILSNKPRTESKTISVSLKGNPKSWANSLSDAGFNSLEVGKSSLIAKKFQSHDFSGNVYHQVTFELSKNKLRAEYTIDESKNSSLREMEIAHLLLLTLSAVGGASLSPELSSYLSSLFERCGRALSPSSAELEYKNSQMQKTIHELTERLAAVYSQKEKDSKQSLADARRIVDLESRLSLLTNLPDSMLAELVLSWITPHGGEIYMQDFCTRHDTPASRVEQSLDRLSKASKIRRV